MRVPNIDSAMSRLPVRQPLVIPDDIGIGLAPGVVNPALARGKISKRPTQRRTQRPAGVARHRTSRLRADQSESWARFLGLFDYGRAATRSSHLRCAAQAWP